MSVETRSLVMWGIFHSWGKPDLNHFLRDTELMVWHLMDKYKMPQGDARAIVSDMKEAFPDGKTSECPITLVSEPRWMRNC